MPVLLRIDASVRLSGSYSRELADHFETRWVAAHPGGRVARRDLAVTPPPHLTADVVEVFSGGRNGPTPDSDELIEELQQADHLLISTPLYNFGMPSPLKAWFDQTLRIGRTFQVRDGVYLGLLKGKRATVILTCGSPALEDNDYLTGGLKRALAFIGIHAVESITLAGTSLDRSTVAANVKEARKEIDAIFGCVDTGIYQGEFTANDQREINELRQGQGAAITAGDASAYASLCAEDVQLLIPGHEPILGRAALREAEERLFCTSQFHTFRKQPLRVDRSGDMAVETGQQMVSSTSSQPGRGVYATRQKYTHVYRKTESGWRFALLMSNDCEQKPYE